MAGPQMDSLFDEVLPLEVRELPSDLAKLDVLLADGALLRPIATCGCVWPSAPPPNESSMSTPMP